MTRRRLTLRQLRALSRDYREWPWDDFSQVQLDLLRSLPGIPPILRATAQAETRLRSDVPLSAPENTPEVTLQMLILVMRRAGKLPEPDPRIAKMKAEVAALTREELDQSLAEIYEEFSAGQGDQS